MGLFANGDGHYNQGQRPWSDAQRAVFADGDNQPVNYFLVQASSSSRRCDNAVYAVWYA
jgi:hypothetical protein